MGMDPMVNQRAFSASGDLGTTPSSSFEYLHDNCLQVWHVLKVDGPFLRLNLAFGQNSTV